MSSINLFDEPLLSPTPIQPSGPVPAKILIVGEAPGKDEDFLGKPFVGASGQELRRMLAQAGIDPNECRMTNVFMQRPKDNDVAVFCGKRKDVSKIYPYPPLAQGQYVLDHHAEIAFANLRGEIERTQPSLVLALGNTATWALVGRTGIGKLRGSIFPCAIPGVNVPVLPTYHPAAILRDWSQRVIAVADFMKGLRYVTEGLRSVRRELWLEPTIDEVERFCSERILAARPEFLSFDIETFGETITCIGFSPSPTVSITIPFYDSRKPDRNYWPDVETELRAWKSCHAVLSSPLPKCGQNGLYDIQYLYRAGIPVVGYRSDSMIRHHSLYPEMEKGLGFLASMYTDEAPWKVLRDRNKDNLKIDDE